MAVLADPQLLTKTLLQSYRRKGPSNQRLLPGLTYSHRRHLTGISPSRLAVVPGSIAAQRTESVAICPLVEEPQAPRISVDVFLVRRKDKERAAVLALSDALRDWAARR